MSVRRKSEGHCGKCHALQDITYYRSINAQRAPEIRQSILVGNYGRIECATCGTVNTFESPTSYVDLYREQIVLVQPDRSQIQRSIESATRGYKTGPAWLVSTFNDCKKRVVTSLDCLRELLLIWEQTSDDEIIYKTKRVAMSRAQQDERVFFRELAQSTVAFERYSRNLRDFRGLLLEPLLEATNPTHDWQVID